MTGPLVLISSDSTKLQSNRIFFEIQQKTSFVHDFACCLLQVTADTLITCRRGICIMHITIMHITIMHITIMHITTMHITTMLITTMHITHYSQASRKLTAFARTFACSGNTNPGRSRTGRTSTKNGP